MTSISDLSPSETERARKRLTNFYTKHALDNFGHVEKALKMSLPETELFSKLCDKFRVSVSEEEADARAAGVFPDVNMRDLSPSEKERARKRLTNFYTKHAPDNMAAVDKALQMSMTESPIFSKICMKYAVLESEEEADARAAGVFPGQSTIATKAISSAKKAVQMDPRTRLERFYTKYDPSKLQMIDTVLKKYEGNEREMFSLLVRKYGPEPKRNEDLTTTSSSSYPTTAPSLATVSPSSSPSIPTDNYADNYNRLTRFFDKYNPSKKSDIEKILETYKGKEKQLFETLVKKYGPEPSSSSSTETKSTAQEDKNNTTAPTDTSTKTTNYYDRLSRIYAKYDPERNNSEYIEKVLSKYEGEETQLFETLVQKYGPEPSSSTEATSVAPKSASDTSTKTTNYYDRLSRFYAEYDPQKNKPEQIKMVLNKFAGNEDHLFEMLTAKYGPEPPSNDDDNVKNQEQIDDDDAGDISEATKTKIKYMFDMFDSDGSGFLEGSEAIAAMTTLFPHDSISLLLDHIMIADVNKDKKLSLEEFTSIAKDVLASDM